MTSEQGILRLAGFKPGLRLAHVREAALPMLKLTLDILVQEARPLPAMQEFALKAIDVGITSIQGVSDFLGVERDVLADPLQDLWHQDLIDVSTGNMTITPSGQRAILDLAAITPVRRVIDVGFDLSLRRVVLFRSLTLRPKDVGEMGLDSVPLPRGHAKKPHPDELSTDDVSKLIPRAFGSAVSPVELLGIRRIDGTAKYFVPALLLIYVDPTTSACQVSVAIDERISSEHEAAVGLAGGAAAIGLDCASFLRSSPDVQRFIPSQLAGHHVSDQMYQRLERRMLASSAGGDDEQFLKDEGPTVKDMTASTASPDEAKAAIDRLVVRPVRVYEHPEILRSALDDSTRRLLIISPWITTGVVDDGLLQRIESACRRGVAIHVGFGIGDGGPFGRPRDERPISNLRDIARRHKNFTLVDLGNTHAKVLVCDDFIVKTSFNWLSFRGDPDRTFRQEEGVLIREPQHVNEEYEYFRSMIEASAG